MRVRSRAAVEHVLLAESGALFAATLVPRPTDPMLLLDLLPVFAIVVVVVHDPLLWRIFDRGRVIRRNSGHFISPDKKAANALKGPNGLASSFARNGHPFDNGNRGWFRSSGHPLHAGLLCVRVWRKRQHRGDGRSQRDRAERIS